MTRLTDVGKMILGWLESEGYDPKEIQSPDARWVLEARMPNGWKHFVLQKDRDEECVQIVSSYVFTPEEVQVLRGLPAQRLSDFFWEIRLKLLFQATEFQMAPAKEGIPTGFSFARQLSFDGGLTRNHFMEALREVHKANLLVTWMYHREVERDAIEKNPNARLLLT